MSGKGGMRKMMSGMKGMLPPGMGGTGMPPGLGNFRKKQLF